MLHPVQSFAFLIPYGALERERRKLPRAAPIGNVLEQVFNKFLSFSEYLIGVCRLIPQVWPAPARSWPVHKPSPTTLLFRRS